MITAKRLRELLRYSKRSGRFTRLVTLSNRSPKGSVIGSAPNSHGYITICVGGERHYAHRLAWLYVTGRWPKRIDHKNTLGSDNRWSNLRVATKGQNASNSKLARSNTSGFKGVHWHAGARRWRAMIRAERRTRHLGYFDTAKAAHAAYRRASRQHHGKFARFK